MNQENKEIKISENDDKTKVKFMVSVEKYKLGVVFTTLTVLVAIAFVFSNLFRLTGQTLKLSGIEAENTSANLLSSQQTDNVTLEEMVLPENGVILPITWGDIGKQMVEAGVIDSVKFEAIYANRGGLDEYDKSLLYGEGNENIEMDSENAGFLLNLLWAFGLANKNAVLEQGPMQDPKYGGANRFASTGGWTIAKGNVMNHYSQYSFVTLTPEQQALVERTSKNIYRPCCGNSTYFPDCNHGMAMLGLLELLAAQGISEDDMYKIALKVNSYWFPSTYLTIAKYFEMKDVDWDNVSPKTVLGADYSSGGGYRRVLSEVEPVPSGGGGGCGV
jgi:hypothetical protein